MSTRRKFIKTVAAGSAIATLSPNVLINALEDDSYLLKQFFELTDPTTDEIKNTRLLEFPFFYVGAEPGKEENKKLLAALKKFAHRKRFDDYSPIESFISVNPNSTWNASLIANLGTELFKTGRYSSTINYLQKAWYMLKSQTEETIADIANQVVCELARMYSWIGRIDDLESLIKEISDRSINASCKELLTGAKDGLFMMRMEQEKSFKCGVLALSSILTMEGKIGEFVEQIRSFSSSKNGFSLTQIYNFSQKFGMNYQMAKREKGAPIIVPCVMNLKLEHYCAIIGQHGNEYKLQDSTFGTDFSQWIHIDVIEEESSGYFLVPNGELPEGWSKVNESTGNKIWGKGATGDVDPDRNTQYDKKKDDGQCSNGMAVYNVHLLKVNLLIQDTPIGYTPPRGLPVYTKLSYNHREAGQPAIMNYSNFGKLWTFNWSEFIEDSGLLAPETDTVSLFDEEGGQLKFRDGKKDNTDKNYHYKLEPYSQAKLIRDPKKDYYMMTMPDGSQKIYAFSDGALGTKRRVFLSEIIDNTGVNKITLSYTRIIRGGVRLDSVNDANGLSTIFKYENALQPLQITKIIDPYGRHADFFYDDIGRLVKINDVFNIASAFTYDSIDRNFIAILTTPYGDTNFLFENGVSHYDADNPSYQSITRTLTVTDINGDKEIVEYGHFASHDINHNGLNYYPYDDPEIDTPSQFRVPANSSASQRLGHRNTFYWDKKTLSDRPNRILTDAKVYNFTHSEIASENKTGGFLKSIKYPLENRIWYLYPGQPHNNNDNPNPDSIGTINKPSQILRQIEKPVILPNENPIQEQAYKMTYNSFGKVIQITDPIGRTTTFSYDLTNPLNLTGFYQRDQGTDVQIVKIEYDDIFKNLPKLIRDGSGTITQYQYNGFGQLKKIFLPSGLVIKFNYDNEGFLDSIQKGLPNKSGLFEWKNKPFTTYFTYAFYNNKKSNLISSITDPEGINIRFTYDSMQRITKVLYKDKSFEYYEYENLHLKRYTDRTKLNVTDYEYDAFRRLISITGPVIGKGDNHRPKTLIEWCKCGSIKKLTDPNSNVTLFEHDIQGRLTRKIYADGSDEIYHYEEKSGRLSWIKDPNDQKSHFDYWLDDNLKRISYTNEAGGALNPPTPSISYVFDQYFNRLIQMTDGLGTTDYHYVLYNLIGGGNLANIVSSLHGTTTEFQYDNMGQMTNRILKRNLPPNEILNAHDWKYDILGRVSEEKNGLGDFAYEYMGGSMRLSKVTGPNQMRTIYDWHNQYAFPLLKSMKTVQGVQQLINFEYDYFPGTLNISKWKRQMGVGNFHENSVYDLDYDNLNRLYSADLKDQNNLSLKRYQYGYDEADNLRKVDESVENTIKNFEINNLNQATSLNNETLKYDKNGNLTEDETKQYQWNAANQLVKIIYKGTNDSSQFYYDGLRRLVKLVEVSSGNTTEQLYHYNGLSLCAEQNSQGNIERTHYAQGIINGAGMITPQTPALFNVRDHLSSVRGRINVNNNVFSNIRDYDPFGEVNSSTNVTIRPIEVGYSSYLFHSKSNLNLTLFRAYNSSIARWISRDPIAENGGINLYTYVANSPTIYSDQLGLSEICDDLKELREKTCYSEEYSCNEKNLPNANWAQLNHYKNTHIGCFFASAMSIKFGCLTGYKVKYIPGYYQRAKDSLNGARKCQERMNKIPVTVPLPAPQKQVISAPSTPSPNISSGENNWENINNIGTVVIGAAIGVGLIFATGGGILPIAGNAGIAIPGVNSGSYTHLGPDA